MVLKDMVGSTLQQIDIVTRKAIWKEKNEQLQEAVRRAEALEVSRGRDTSCSSNNILYPDNLSVGQCIILDKLSASQN